MSLPSEPARPAPADLVVDGRLSPEFFPYAYGGPALSGILRLEPEDFMVDEIPLVEPDGRGQHCLLHLEKRLCNTDWVAGRIARLAGVPRRDVGYAGLKDRRAVARQWFSVGLQGRAEPDWSVLESAEIRILATCRHSRKLRRGALRGNRFRIRIRALCGDLSHLLDTLSALRAQGCPNYFAEQRFGREGGNLIGAQALFSGAARRIGRQRRGLYLSAVRALLFNLVLARRVVESCWFRPLAGDRLLLDGRRSSFSADRLDGTILRRVRDQDLHPSGPLYGRGDPGVTGEAARLEADALASAGPWKEGLVRCGVEMARRSLRAPVRELDWSVQNEELILAFTLPRGSYATAVLRECVRYRTPD